MKANVRHISTRTSAASSVSSPAPRKASTIAAARSVDALASAPTTKRASDEGCTITPGSGAADSMYATPPRATPRPIASRTRSALSMPFWKERIAVRVPTAGATHRAAAALSYVFTRNSSTSTTPALAGSSVARTATRKSPCALRTSRGPSRIAARRGPRARKTTSPPVRLSFAPT